MCVNVLFCVEWSITGLSFIIMDGSLRRVGIDCGDPKSFQCDEKLRQELRWREVFVIRMSIHCYSHSSALMSRTDTPPNNSLNNDTLLFWLRWWMSQQGNGKRWNVFFSFFLFPAAMLWRRWCVLLYVLIVWMFVICLRDYSAVWIGKGIRQGLLSSPQFHCYDLHRFANKSTKGQLTWSLPSHGSPLHSKEEEKRKREIYSEQIIINEDKRSASNP